MLVETPGPAHHGELQNADVLLAIFEGQAEDGGEWLGLPVRRPSLPMLIIVHSQRFTALQYLAGKPFAGRQAHAGVVLPVAAADNQLQVASCLIDEINTPGIDP